MTSLRHSARLRYCAAWTLAGVYSASHDIFTVPPLALALFTVAHFGVWALLGLVAMPLMRAMPLRLDWRPWLFHLVAGAVFAQVDITAGHWIYAQLTGNGRALTLLELAALAFQTCFHLALLTYWGLLGVVQGHDALALARRRERQLAEQGNSLAQARLQQLKAQLQPHFLFNTLNAIASLMHYDVDTADRMLNRLSDLLRLSLRETGTDLLPLEQEIRHVQTYLDIEQIRFEDRLALRWEVPRALHGVPVPSFILQPLLENAIKYGIAPRTGGGTITVRAAVERGSLRIDVADDAPPAGTEAGLGIGLRNVRARLHAHYGERQQLILRRGEGGTVVSLILPMPATPEAVA